MMRRQFLQGAVALALKRDRLDAAAALIEKATARGYFSAASLHVKQGSFLMGAPPDVGIQHDVIAL